MIDDNCIDLRAEYEMLLESKATVETGIIRIKNQLVDLVEEKRILDTKLKETLDKLKQVDQK